MTTKGWEKCGIQWGTEPENAALAKALHELGTLFQGSKAAEAYVAPCPQELLDVEDKIGDDDVEYVPVEDSLDKENNQSCGEDYDDAMEDEHLVPWEWFDMEMDIEQEAEAPVKEGEQDGNIDLSEEDFSKYFADYLQ